jgi:hypothetical protein
MSLLLIEIDGESDGSILQFIEAADQEIRLRTKKSYQRKFENVFFISPPKTENDYILIDSICNTAIAHLSGILEQHFYLLTPYMQDTIADGIDRIQRAMWAFGQEIGNDG